MGTHTIGKKIRACREERGMSQEVFAEKVGISPAYVGMIERGEKIPRLETFLRIANSAFGLLNRCNPVFHTACINGNSNVFVYYIIFCNCFRCIGIATF